MDLQQLEREWVTPSSENGALQAKIWDARAAGWKEKPLPSVETNLFLQEVQRKVQPEASMRILDIGCGTGGYTMALAPFAERAVGTDVSPEMIRLAKEKAAQLGLENTEFLVQDWGTADPDAAGWRGAFDLVFAHMTPAICDFQTLDHMNACAKGHCFLVKPARRTDAVQDAAFARAGITGHRGKMDDTVANAFWYLWLKGYCPEVSCRDEVWEMEQSLAEMTHWCVHRAELYQKLTCAEEEAIASYLKEISVDGMVKETVTTKIVTIDWKV